MSWNTAKGTVPYGTTLDSLARRSVDRRQRKRSRRYTVAHDTYHAHGADRHDKGDKGSIRRPAGWSHGGDGEEELHILEHPLLIHRIPSGRRPHATYAAGNADFGGGVRLAGV